MALSSKARKALDIALAGPGLSVQTVHGSNTSKEVADAIDALHAVAPAAHVANIEPTTNLPASNASLSTGDTYTDAAVKTAIDGAVNALRVPAEARLDAIEAKIDAILAALQAAGLMS